MKYLVLWYLRFFLRQIDWLVASVHIHNQLHSDDTQLNYVTYPFLHRTVKKKLRIGECTTAFRTTGKLNTPVTRQGLGVALYTLKDRSQPPHPLVQLSSKAQSFSLPASTPKLSPPTIPSQAQDLQLKLNSWSLFFSLSLRYVLSPTDAELRIRP